MKSRSIKKPDISVDNAEQISAQPEHGPLTSTLALIEAGQLILPGLLAIALSASCAKEPPPKEDKSSEILTVPPGEDKRIGDQVSYHWKSKVAPDQYPRSV